MRALVTMLSSVGLLLGAAAAVVWHYTRVRHDFGWFAYAPLSASSPPRGPGWWPAALILPSIGLAFGALAGAGLGRLGWRLTRD